MRIIAATLALAALVGCGADAAYMEAAGIEDEDSGALEQSIVVNEGYGFRTDLPGSNVRCTKPSSAPVGQVCTFPFDKSVSFRVTTDGGLSATRKTEFEAYIDGALTSWPGQFPAWSLSRVTSGGDVRIRKASLSGTATNSIHSYARITTVSTPGDFDEQLTGLYRDYGPGGIVCSIDIDKIVNDFTSAQEPRIFNHAVLYCMAKGLGLGSGAPSNRPDASLTTPDAVKSLTFSNRSKCYVNNYDPSSPPSVTFSTACNGESD